MAVLFAQTFLGLSDEDRQLLSAWSDIFGVVGFFISVGLGVISVAIARRVEAAKREANEAVERVARSLFRRDLADARHSVEMAREGCRARQWVRAVGHFDVGTSRMIRLLSGTLLDDAERVRLREATDNARILVEAIRQKKVATGELSQRESRLLDTTIEILALIEGRFDVGPQEDRLP